MGVLRNHLTDEPEENLTCSRPQIERSHQGPVDVYGPAVLSVGLLFALVWNALRWPLPEGYAGLYVLMSKSIFHTHFAPPLRIGLYGPGGIPFAYPPLALYLMAFWTGIMHIPVFGYLRFAAPIFLSASAIPLYLFYRSLLDDRLQALFASSLMLTTSSFLLGNAFADGSVRALAFLFTILALLFTQRALSRPTNRDVGLAIVCFGCAALSHLENLRFLAVSIVVLALAGGSMKRRLTIGAAVIGGGLAVSAPWWIWVGVHHGVGVILNAASSHGGFGGLLTGLGQDPRLTLAVIVYRYLPGSPLDGVEYAIALLGLAVCVRRGQWLLPLWLLPCLLIISLFPASIAMIVAAAAAIVASDVVRAASASMVSHRYTIFPYLIGIVVVLGYVFVRLGIWLEVRSPSLTNADLISSKWVHAHTASSSKYFLATDDSALAEWFPYLSGRTPVLGDWGAEWKGTANYQGTLFWEQAFCVRIQSASCLQRVIASAGLHPEFIILARAPAHRRLVGGLQTSGRWTVVHPGADQVWASNVDTQRLTPR